MARVRLRSNSTGLKDASSDLVPWAVRIVCAAVVIYLVAFFVLVSFPQALATANALGLTGDHLETIYSPIIRLLDY